MGKIHTHFELRVYERAFEAAMALFRASRDFPADERFSLTDQVRRSSRSVCTNLAEAWAKRRYEAAFVAKLTDSIGEANETQTWIEFAVSCGYLDRTRGSRLHNEYGEIISMLSAMANRPELWIINLPG